MKRFLIILLFVLISTPTTSFNAFGVSGLTAQEQRELDKLNAIISGEDNNTVQEVAPAPKQKLKPKVKAITKAKPRLRKAKKAKKVKKVRKAKRPSPIVNRNRMANQNSALKLRLLELEKKVNALEAKKENPASPSPSVFAGKDVKIKIGGQLRFRPEQKNNFDFNSSTGDYRSFVGQRIRLNFKATVGDNIEALLQVQDTRQWGSSRTVGSATKATPNNVATGKEANSLDYYQAWFKVKNLFGSSVSLKMGRQQLVYGSQRLLGNLGWTDQARSFDALKLIVKVGPGQIDLFSAKLKDTDTGSSTTNEDQYITGAYSMWKLDTALKLDLYYLLWTDENNGRNLGTTGARVAGKMHGFDYTGEYASQGGDWTKSSATTVSQSASAYALTAGYTADYAWKSRLGFEFASGSGDDGIDATTHKSFVFPFHTNHAHYGYMDFFSWANMEDFAIKLKTKPGGGKAIVKLDYHIFKLKEAKGDWLNVVGTGTVFKGNSGYTKTDAGTEIDFTLVYPYNKHLKVVSGYSTFQPGDAVKERNANKADNADWGYVMFIMNF